VDVELAGVPFFELHLKRGERGAQLPLVRNPREASQLFALCFPEGIHIGHLSLASLPNESRLRCGALKKDSFRNLRAPPASSAC